jgi:predicted ATPase
MIETIQIKNFKSVVDLSLDLGTFNVLIGENGCGKSNILEAIAFGAAASADKLDYEFLGSRGIRATNPEFMFSAFSNGKKRKSITIDFQTDERDYAFDLVNETNNPKKWTNKNKKIAIEEIQKQINAIYLEDDEEKRNKIFRELDGDKAILSTFSDAFKPLRKEQGYIDFFSNVYPTILEKAFSSEEISNYIIYSPEQSSLRRFEETTQIYPLGIRGEGLFQYLKELALDKKSAKLLADVKENLGLLDWYEGFDLPENLLKNETSLTIRDKYLHPSLQYFDQRSTNEGFLFLLFYSTLFISRTTPRFFAIDNIDASFNPKLCQQLTRNLASLAKKNKKQVIVTTQNPAILDGLNLKDNQQRLFVVRRNDEGHTKAKRIEYKADRTMKLSEVWTSGFIGGLPENF